MTVADVCRLRVAACSSEYWLTELLPMSTIEASEVVQLRCHGCGVTCHSFVVVIELNGVGHAL
jgi:hypothetical protein